MRFADYYSEPSRNGLTKPKRVRGEGFKFLNMGELFANRRIKNIRMDRAPLTEKEAERSLLAPGDLLFARQSMVASGAGKCSIFLGDDDPVTFDSHLIRVRLDKSRCSPDFVFYFFESPTGKSLTHSIVSQGAGVAGITGSDLSELNIDFPSVAEQRDIAAVLRALDDKIEVNRRMAGTLEAMARALYRSWFVDFDPVTARAEGRAPAHMDPATAAIFPDRFGEDGLPKGWKMAALAEICDTVRRNVKPQDHPSAPYQHFSLPAFDKGAGPECVHGAEIKSNKLDVPNDAILFSRLNPAIPRVWWARVNSAIGTPAASTEFFVAKAANERETPWLYALLSSYGFRDEAKSRVTGTSNSHQRVPPKALAEIQVIHPPHCIRDAFGSIALPWFRRAQAVTDENRTLAALRDTLLPKLMSGELRVREAKAQVAEAV